MNTKHTHSDTAALDRKLNQAILAGDILSAFETYYADDVVMHENDSPPFTGKSVNRKREEDFVNSVQEFHEARLLGEAVNGDTSYSEWEYDLTFKSGIRMTLQQVAARRWKNGQVSHERFYYKAGQ
jgi:ketosteroid isomerase-like protein